MQFKRIDKETVRCIISEDDLKEHGLDMDDFLANGEKTENFIKMVIDMASEEVGYQAPSGALSIQAAVLPDHMLILTLSERADGGILSILENLKTAVGMLAKEADSRASVGNEKRAKKATGCQECYELEFTTMDHVLRYAESVNLTAPFQNLLYKLEKTGYYYLVLKKGKLSEQQMCWLLGSALDFAENIFSDVGLLAYLDEHGEKILAKDALQTLQAL